MTSVVPVFMWDEAYLEMYKSVTGNVEATTFSYEKAQLLLSHLKTEVEKLTASNLAISKMMYLATIDSLEADMEVYRKWSREQEEKVLSQVNTNIEELPAYLFTPPTCVAVATEGFCGIEAVSSVYQRRLAKRAKRSLQVQEPVVETVEVYNSRYVTNIYQRNRRKLVYTSEIKGVSTPDDRRFLPVSVLDGRILHIEMKEG